jgi:hypothetical protein
LTVTIGRIRKLAALGYFVEGSTRDLGEEVIPEPGGDEHVVFEEFFTAGLWMPPQSVLVDILVKFRVQLHHLTPNAFAQLSKYFWAVMSFGREPSSVDGFAKRYKLHYQPKKVEIGGGEKFQQFCCLNFHVRCSGGGTKVWFYCKVHAHVCSQEGSLCMPYVHTYVAWTFGQSPLLTALMMTRGMLRLSRPLNLSEVRTPWKSTWPVMCIQCPPVSRLKLPLSNLEVVRRDDEDDIQFLARVELDAELPSARCLCC